MVTVLLSGQPAQMTGTQTKESEATSTSELPRSEKVNRATPIGVPTTLESTKDSPQPNTLQRTNADQYDTGRRLCFV